MNLRFVFLFYFFSSPKMHLPHRLLVSYPKTQMQNRLFQMQNRHLSNGVTKICLQDLRLGAAVHFKPWLFDLLHCRQWNSEAYLQLIGLDVSAAVGVILPPGLQRTVTPLTMWAKNIYCMPGAGDAWYLRPSWPFFDETITEEKIGNNFEYDRDQISLKTLHKSALKLNDAKWFPARERCARCVAKHLHSTTVKISRAIVPFRCTSVWLNGGSASA